VELGDTFLEKHPPRSVIGWGPTYAGIAISLIELGHYERARALCEQALSAISEADKKYYIMYAPLEGAYASALLMLGEVEESTRRFEALQRRLEDCGEPAGAVLMHEVRARMQKRVGDREGYLRSLDVLRRSAIASGQPSVVMFADAVAAAQTRFTYDSAPPEMLAAAARAAASDLKDDPVGQTAVTQLLTDCSDPSARARKALQLIADAAEAWEGYLYLLDESGVSVAAALQDRPPPSSLASRVAELAKTSARAGMVRLEQPDLDGPHVVIFLTDRTQPNRGPLAGAVLKLTSNARPAVPDSVVQGVARMLAQKPRELVSDSEDIKTVRRA
jgi:tetratricopeptide (TPR) repeat protein